MKKITLLMFCLNIINVCQVFGQEYFSTQYDKERGTLTVSLISGVYKKFNYKAEVRVSYEGDVIHESKSWVGDSIAPSNILYFDNVGFSKGKHIVNVSLFAHDSLLKGRDVEIDVPDFEYYYIDIKSSQIDGYNRDVNARKILKPNSKKINADPYYLFTSSNNGTIARGAVNKNSNTVFSLSGVFPLQKDSLYHLYALDQDGFLGLNSDDVLASYQIDNSTTTEVDIFRWSPENVGRLNDFDFAFEKGVFNGASGMFVNVYPKNERNYKTYFHVKAIDKLGRDFKSFGLEWNGENYAVFVPSVLVLNAVKLDLKYSYKKDGYHELWKVSRNTEIPFPEELELSKLKIKKGKRTRKGRYGKMTRYGVEVAYQLSLPKVEGLYDNYDVVQLRHKESLSNYSFTSSDQNLKPGSKLRVKKVIPFSYLSPLLDEWNLKSSLKLGFKDKVLLDTLITRESLKDVGRYKLVVEEIEFKSEPKYPRINFNVDHHKISEKKLEPGAEFDFLMHQDSDFTFEVDLNAKDIYPENFYYHSEDFIGKSIELDLKELDPYIHKLVIKLEKVD